MKKQRKVRKKRLLTLFSFFVTCGILFAQNMSVTGTIKDAKGLPIAGVNVIEKGTINGSLTDFDGGFSIKVSSSSTTLTVSFLGYATQEVSVKGKRQFNIVLLEEVASLDEVVVIGYGGVKRGDLTGSVSSVSSKDLNLTVNQSFQEALEGRAAGVQLLSGEGSPGGSVSIRIRGGTSISASNEPLYVIDGIPIFIEEESGISDGFATTSSNPLSAIDPSDIKSIEILKDASATAIYGSRGANGVVIITTNQGTIGKSELIFESYISSQQIADKLDLLSPEQFGQYRLDLDDFQNDELRTRMQDFVQNPQNYETADWQDRIFRTSFLRNYKVGLKGGNDALRYNVSLGAFLNEGIIDKSSFERFYIRGNFSGEASDKLKYKAYFYGANTLQKGAPTGGGNQANSGVITQAARFTPVILSGDINDFENDLNGNQSFAIFNPVSQLENITIENQADFFQSNLTLEYLISKNLKLQTLLGFNIQNRKNANFFTSNTGWGRVIGGGIGTIRHTYNRSWLNENTLTYTQDFGKHSITALAGATFQQANIETFTARNSLFEIEDLGFNDLSLGTVPSVPQSNADNWALASGLARINYNYDDRYLITASFRADGSSRFAEGKKWGYFPALAVAWKVKNESLFKNFDALSDLKLRLGFGITGNQEISRYQSLSTFSTEQHSFGYQRGLFYGIWN